MDADDPIQTEAGAADEAQNVPMDAPDSAPAASPVLSASDASSDAATQASMDASGRMGCRIVDPEYDAGVDDVASEVGPVITGVISHEGDCLSRVEVCLSFPLVPYGMASSTAFTDQHGMFELRNTVGDYLGMGFDPFSVEVKPRKSGYEFEPPFEELTVGPESNVEGLAFAATGVDVPAHATGRWRIVEDTGEASEETCSDTPDEPGQCDRGTFRDETGCICLFKDGCLFGGIGCVKGLDYLEQDAMCTSLYPQPGMVRPLPPANQGTFDPATQTWRITRTMEIRMVPVSNRLEKTMVLERVP